MKHSLFSFILACLITTPLMAGDLYVEAGAMYLSADDTVVKLHPAVPKVKLGYAITPHYMIEVQYAGSGDDTDDETGATMTVDNITAAYLRLDSDIHAGFRMYVLLGQAETNLTASGINGFNAVDDKYSDFSWGVGIEDRTWGRNLFLTLEYNQYYSETDTKLVGGSIGMKYAF